MILAEFSSEVLDRLGVAPPWGPDRITADGRDQLRALGFNV